MNADERELVLKNETYAIVGAAMEVSNALGVGFLEGVYQDALAIEFRAREIPFAAQAPLAVFYKGHKLSKEYVPDFICYDQVIVEIKALKQLTSIEEAQLLNYLKAARKPVGILINFGSPKMEWKRMVLTQPQVKNATYRGTTDERR